MKPQIPPLCAFSLLALLVGLAGAGRCEALSGAEAPRPNILFIYADDHSPKVLSCYEDSYAMADTPHIDRLAAGGVRFAAAYLGSWCMPSRASLLTGLHSHTIESMRMTGANPRSTYDPEQCPFWPAALRAHGYHTAQIGKWHTGTDTGWGRDWDYQRVWNRPGNPENAGRYFGPQIIESNGEAAMVEGYSTDNYTRWACDYIRGEGRDSDRPWYLWLCYGAIHTPTTPAARHRGALAEAVAEAPPGMFGPRPGRPGYLERTQSWAKGPDGEVVHTRSGMSHADWMRRVHECLMAVDEGVGELLQALEESGQLESTLVVYTSDQGFANGEHGMRQKVAPYEATYSSPFIASWPGTVPAGKVSAHTVNAPDVVATFLSLAGADPPWEMPGRDFTPLLLDPEGAEAPEWERPTLFVHTGQLYGSDVSGAVREGGDLSHAGVPYYGALRRGGWKYVRYFQGDVIEELYDLGADPDELENLARHPAHAGRLEEFRELWLEEMRASGADFLDALPGP